MADKKGANGKQRRLRSRDWFDAPGDPTMTALYLERYLNFGLTLRRAAQRPADHRHRPDRQRPVALQPPPPRAGRARARRHPRLPAASRSSSRSIPSRRPASGRRRRSTATSPISAWSRCLYGYFFDGVVLTTGCDKTTPGHDHGRRARSTSRPSCCRAGRCSTAISPAAWRAPAPSCGTPARSWRRAASTWSSSSRWCASSAPSVGHCNTMGTALSMNSMAEALGMSLTGCAAIPGAVPRARPDGLRDRQAHRRHGVGGPEAVRHPDAQGLRERHRRRRARSAPRPTARRTSTPSRAISASSSTTPTGTRSATTSRCW